LQLHPKVLTDLHECLAKGHFGINTTIQRILATCYWWPTLNKKIVLLSQNKVFNYEVMNYQKELIFIEIKLLNIRFVKNNNCTNIYQCANIYLK